MGRDLQSVTQYQLTSDIVKNHYVFDIKDGALKVLLLLSTHYPNILINRKSLMKRYKMAEKTVDRALKELSEKSLINRHDDGQITLNVSVIYGHIDGEKVVNLTAPCMNKQEIANKNNKHDNNNVVVDLLKDFSFSDDEIHHLMSKHSTESLQAYAKYVQHKKAENPKKYLLWCLKEKPVIEQQQTKRTSHNPTEQTNDAQRYAALMSSNETNFLNSLPHAQTYLVNTTQFDLRNDTILKDCIAIMLHWKLQIQDYNALMLIDEAAVKSLEFKQKTARLAAQIWTDLQTAKMTVESLNSALPIDVAC